MPGKRGQIVIGSDHMTRQQAEFADGFKSALLFAIVATAALGRSLSAAQAAPPAGTPNTEVCDAVADAYNNGRQDRLWGYPDPVDIAGDGKLRHVYIFAQGTAHVPQIIASTKALSDDEQQDAVNDSEVDFYSAEDDSIDYDALPNVMMFKGAYYVVYEVDDGPAAVVKPDKGVLCKFKRHFSAALTEDHAPALCKRVSAGAEFARLPTRPLPADFDVDNPEVLELPGAGTPLFKRYAETKLDAKGTPVRIGYFDYESGAGAGCDVYGIAILNGRTIEQSAANKALSAAQEPLMDCRGSRTFVVEADGENLVEIDGGIAAQRNIPPRILARLTGDRVETVCRVEQKASFMPAPADKKHGR